MVKWCRQTFGKACTNPAPAIEEKVLELLDADVARLTFSE
jgi:hypothetical protein